MRIIQTLTGVLIASIGMPAFAIIIDFEGESLGSKPGYYNGGVAGVEIHSSADSGLRVVDNSELHSLLFSTTYCGGGNRCLYTRQTASSTSFLYVRLPVLTNEVSVYFSSNVEGDLFLSGYLGAFGIDDKVASYRDSFQNHSWGETLTLTSPIQFDHISLDLIMRAPPYVDNIKFVVDNINIASYMPIPEPSLTALLLSGSLLLFLVRRKYA